MIFRRTSDFLGLLRSGNPRQPLLGFAGCAVSVLAAALFSEKAHRAGLPEHLTFYPLAVACVSALWGIPHGLFAALLSVLLNRLPLVHTPAAALSTGTETVHLFAFGFSTVAAAWLVGLVREQRDQIKGAARALEAGQAKLVEAHHELRAAEARRDEFCRDILLALSHGKLRLCPAGEMGLPPGEAVLHAELRTPSDITVLRHAVARLAHEQGMERERAQDLEVCLGEATTNALVHGGGGQASVHVDVERIWIRVADAGPGIDQRELPRATLVKGYSTRASLGMGFSIMQELADSVCLCTGEHGTQVLLEMHLRRPEKSSLDLALLGLDLDESWDAADAPTARLATPGPGQPQIPT